MDEKEKKKKNNEPKKKKNTNCCPVKTSTQFIDFRVNIPENHHRSNCRISYHIFDRRTGTKWCRSCTYFWIYPVVWKHSCHCCSPRHWLRTYRRNLRQHWNTHTHTHTRFEMKPRASQWRILRFARSLTKAYYFAAHINIVFFFFFVNSAWKTGRYFFAHSNYFTKKKKVIFICLRITVRILPRETFAPFAPHALRNNVIR